MNLSSARLNRCALRIGLVAACALSAIVAAGTTVTAGPCSTVFIPNPAPWASDEFGFSAAVSGDVAVVGAYRDDPGDVDDAGSAYVYHFDGSAWIPEQPIPNPGPVTGEWFGYSVAVSGDVAVIGAYDDDIAFSNGSASIYRYNGSAWLLEQTLFNPAAEFGDRFGSSVAVSGNVAVVGAFGDRPGGVALAGSVYVYRYNGSTWLLDKTIPNPAPATFDVFGWSVAVSGDVAVIGARADDPGGVFGAGSAYVYRYNGSDWLLDLAIPNPEPAVDDDFGRSVAVSGDVAMVGASDDDPGGVNASGSAYVYRYNGSAWLLDQAIPNPDPPGIDLFGFSVAVSGDVAVVGAHSDSPGGAIDAGSTYVYRFDGSAWLLDSTMANPQPTAGEQFGVSVAVSDDVAWVGARFDDRGSETDAGSAYVFDFGCAAVCCAGDFDASNDVTTLDIPDFVAALLAGDTCPVAPACCAGDSNADGLVDGGDVSDFVVQLLAGGACP